MTQLAPKIGVVIWLWIFSTFLETVAVANREPRMATAFIILAQLTKTVLMVGAVIDFCDGRSLYLRGDDSRRFANADSAGLSEFEISAFLDGISISRFFREQLFYALPFGLAGLLWTLQTDIHNYFVGYRFSEAEFAIYAFGCFELPLIAMLVRISHIGFDSANERTCKRKTKNGK